MNETVVSGTDLKNKFSSQPNKYVFNKHDRYNKNIYAGLNEQFWKGYKAHDEGKYVVDFIELGFQHRVNSGDPYDRAFQTPE